MKKFFLIALLACSVQVMAQNPQYKISVTHGGEPIGHIVLELFPDVAPKHVANFDSLVSVGFYDGTAFHRVIPGFMIQGGGPKSRPERNISKHLWGVSDPDQRTVPAEFSTISHVRGILSTARLGNDINSATSQFFIVQGNSPHLDGKYTVFGKVVEGMDVVDIIVNVPRETVNQVADIPVQKVEMTIVRMDASPVEGDRSGEFSFEVRPNPASDVAEIRFTGARQGNSTLEVFSSVGEKVLEQNLPAGEETTRLNLRELSTGVYFYRISLGKNVFGGRIIRR